MIIQGRIYRMILKNVFSELVIEYGIFAALVKSLQIYKKYRLQALNDIELHKKCKLVI